MFSTLGTYIFLFFFQRRPISYHFRFVYTGTTLGWRIDRFLSISWFYGSSVRFPTVQEKERLVWEDHLNQLEEFYVEEMVDLFHRRVWPGSKILDLRFNLYLRLHNNLKNFKLF